MCGQRQGALRPDESEAVTSRTEEYAAEFEERESQQLSRELFQAHADLLRTKRNESKLQLKRAEQTFARFDDLEEEILSPATTRAVQDLLLEVEDIGDRWEDVQHNYNNESEALDEEFMDRFNELEIDVDLPEVLQAKITEELEAFASDLEALGAAIKVAASRGEGLLSRSEGRWYQGGAPALPPWVDGAALVVAAAIACAVARHLEFSWRDTMCVISPFVMIWAGVTLARHWRR